MIWLSITFAQPSEEWFKNHPVHNMSIASAQIKEHSSKFNQSVGQALGAELFNKLKESEAKIEDSCTEHSAFISFEHLKQPEQSSEEQLFLSNLFGVEQLHCIENTSTESLLETFRSSDFRTSTMPGVIDFSHELIRFHAKGNDLLQSCTETKSGFGVSATSYCMVETEIFFDNTLWIHSVLRSTQEAPTYQPLLFREEAMYLKPYSSGVALYRYTITRGQDLGRTGKYFLEKTLFYTHSSIKEALQVQ